MTNPAYPLKITVDKAAWFANLSAANGIDLEVEMFEWAVQEFQKLDPELNKYHIRAQCTEQLGRTGMIPTKVVITQSTAHLMKTWEEFPQEFLVGMIDALLTWRKRDNARV